MVKIFKSTCTNAYSIWEQGTSVSLKPWGNNTDYYQGSDDGGENYLLPFGYTLGRMAFGEPAIYDEHDFNCPLILDADENVCLIGYHGDIIVLNKCEEIK